MDLVTFGEGLIRVTPADGGLTAHVGGAELNVAVAAARLGVASRWVSRLPDNAAGRFVDGVARAHGVDARVDWAAEGRLGHYFLEQGAAPRQSSVVYDRSGSSFTSTVPGTIKWREQLRGARWYHGSGITPAVSESCAAVAAEALEAARDAGMAVSFDVNYRVKLWDAARARATLQPLLRRVDVLIASEDDARTVFDVRAVSPADVARSLRDRFEIDAVAITVRESAEGLGAIVAAGESTFAAPRCEVEVVERVGTGDAFAAGLIACRLAGRAWDDAARFATAMAALKLTMPGDFFVGDRAMVEALLESAHARPAR